MYANWYLLSPCHVVRQWWWPAVEVDGVLEIVQAVVHVCKQFLVVMCRCYGALQVWRQGKPKISIESEVFSNMQILGNSLQMVFQLLHLNCFEHFQHGSIRYKTISSISARCWSINCGLPEQSLTTFSTRQLNQPKLLNFPAHKWCNQTWSWTTCFTVNIYTLRSYTRDIY